MKGPTVFHSANGGKLVAYTEVARDLSGVAVRTIDFTGRYAVYLHFLPDELKRLAEFLLAAAKEDGA
jgi:hypothetical protein